MPSNENVQVNSISSPYKILVIGGSYAGLSTTLNLLDLCQGRPTRYTATTTVKAENPFKISVQITIVDERDGYYHLIGSPLALATETYSEKAWKKFEDIPALQSPSINWIRGTASSVDCENKVALIMDFNTNQRLEHSYDYFVVASGLRRVFPTIPQSLLRIEYLDECKRHIKDVRTATGCVVVIGGGAVGIEMSAELKLVYPEQTVKLVHSREKLLSSEPLPDKTKDRALLELRAAGVEVILGQRVISNIENGKSRLLTLADGSQMLAGHVISAISRSVPSTTYLPPEAVNEEGYVKITSTLNFPEEISNAAYHFAVGDLVAWSGIKRCGMAMSMGHSAAINIHQQILHKHTGVEPKFTHYPEVPPMIGLAVGRSAVVYSPDQGTTYGPDSLRLMFGDDLGYSICWNYLQLGKGNA
ncbi:hypothetical protein B7463_g1601, partial [Scytalidium lignicola]